MNDCIFCKIINKEIPSTVLYEDSNILAIADAFPIKNGHILVIPKEHYKNIFDIPENIYLDIHKIVSKIAKSYKKYDNDVNINIIQNNGKYAGQMVDHYHTHIVPRHENDDVIYKSIAEDFSQEKTNTIFNGIKNQLGGSYEV